MYKKSGLGSLALRTGKVLGKAIIGKKTLPSISKAVNSASSSGLAGSGIIGGAKKIFENKDVREAAGNVAKGVGRAATIGYAANKIKNFPGKLTENLTSGIQGPAQVQNTDNILASR